MDLAELYEKMKDLESAMMYLESLLTMTESLPLKFLTMATQNYRRLFLTTDKGPEGLQYLEVAISKLKESFGADNVQVGIAYNYLGQACLKVKRPLAAAGYFKDANQIIDASLGPYHEMSVEVYQGLRLAHKYMGSDSEANRIQEIINECLKGNGPKTGEEMEEAVREASMKPFDL